MNKNSIFLTGVILILIFGGAYYFNPKYTWIQIQANNDIQESYSRDLAETLAQFVTASYCVPQNIKKWQCGELCNMHPEVDDVSIMSGPTKNAFGYVAYNSQLDAIMLVFRGTVYNSKQNWWDDADFTAIPYPYCNNNCKVHKGFYQTWKTLENQVAANIAIYVEKYPTSQIIVTGHSLGGALAHHCSAWLSRHDYNYTVYTFGQPRIGDDKFIKWFQEVYPYNYYRITNGQDPVPHLPPVPYGFLHSYTEVFYQDNSTSQIICDGNENRHCSDKWEFSDAEHTDDHLWYMNVNMFYYIGKCMK